MNWRLTFIATVNSNSGHAVSQFFSDIDVLDINKWPSNPSIRYGDKEIKHLCGRLRLNFDQVVSGMRECIERYQQQKTDKSVKSTISASDKSDLQPLISCINTLPVSTAECERNFSLMNLIYSSERNSLLTTTVSSIMMPSINGPPIALWKPNKYLKSWLSKHRSAEDTCSWRVQRQTQSDSRDKL